MLNLLLVVFVYLLIKEWNVILLGELIFIGYYKFDFIYFFEE